jgi:hypothetical protein
VGMGPRRSAPFMMCINDHIFVCPRDLCRPYFHLLELFESPLCRASAKAHTGLATIHAPAESPPQRPFFLPEVPLVLGDAQWYTFARYTSAGRGCRAHEVPASCCGAMREMNWWCTLVSRKAPLARTRGAAPTFDVQCKRISWSCGCPAETWNATARRCYELKVAAERSAVRASWEASPSCKCTRETAKGDGHAPCQMLVLRASAKEPRRAVQEWFEVWKFFFWRSFQRGCRLPVPPAPTCRTHAVTCVSLTEPRSTKNEPRASASPCPYCPVSTRTHFTGTYRAATSKHR